jgi:hypothetical protein
MVRECRCAPDKSQIASASKPTGPPKPANQIGDHLDGRITRIGELGKIISFGQLRRKGMDSSALR